MPASPAETLQGANSTERKTFCKQKAAQLYGPIHFLTQLELQAEALELGEQKGSQCPVEEMKAAVFSCLQLVPKRSSAIAIDLLKHHLETPRSLKEYLA